MAGFNWTLIVIIVVLALLSAATAVYLLIAYQHPEDRNQAWFPKIIVVTGITLAIWMVLLFPIDIANIKSCSPELAASYCTFAIPSETLWRILYILNAGLAFGIIPFAIFYYEADSDLTLPKRILGAAAWEGATLLSAGALLGICYALVGYTIYPVTNVISGLQPLNKYVNTTYSACIFPRNNTAGGNIQSYLCDAIGSSIPAQNWKTRCSFITYIIALSASAGWLLFLVFAGVGLVVFPVDCIKAFLGRPRSTITRSEYIKRAQTLGNRAKAIKEMAEKLKQERRAMGSGGKVRGQYNRINAELLQLEEDHTALELVFPQGEDPGYAWAVTVLGFWLKLAVGVVGACLSIMWLLQVLLYIFIYPPIDPLLNTMFISMDDAFPLFGTFAFAVFCFYLMAVTIKGCTKIGLNLLIFSVHPMKPGATLMNSFLFNVALVLLSSNAVIQFCQQAFELYASGSAISEIWGNEILHLQGLQYVFQLNIFVYCLFSITALTCFAMVFTKPKKWTKKTADKRLEEAYS